MTATRTESDPLGSVEVPAEALYGINTIRAIANFPEPTVRVGDRPEFVTGFGHVKAAAAEANAELGVLDPRVADAIIAAADELADGKWHDQFPIALVQGGGGTATNLAVNEVLANRAGQLLGSRPGSYDTVHPLDHVNRSQSTNDTYPTALQLAALSVASQARAALDDVADALDRLAEAGAGIQRLGRTCLQDALPLPVSAYHAAQATAVRRSSARLAAAATALYHVPLGATAVGTGAGTPPGYRAIAVARLAARTEMPLEPSRDPYDALAHLDPLLELASAAASAAVTQAKIAADLRLLSSGPVGGIAELRVPAVQVGSSMMPGKINPVIPEFVIQLSFEIRGAAHIIEDGVAAGELDLNVMEPVIARHLLEALERLAVGARTFASRCLAGLEWDRGTVELHLAGSLQTIVDSAQRRGHDAVRNKVKLERAGQGRGQAHHQIITEQA